MHVNNNTLISRHGNSEVFLAPNEVIICINIQTAMVVLLCEIACCCMYIRLIRSMQFVILTASVESSSKTTGNKIIWHYHSIRYKCFFMSLFDIFLFNLVVGRTT